MSDATQNQDSTLKKWLIPAYGLLAVAVVAGLLGSLYLYRESSASDGRLIIQAVESEMTKNPGQANPELFVKFDRCATAQTRSAGSALGYVVMKNETAWKATPVHGIAVDWDAVPSEQVCLDLLASEPQPALPAPPIVFASYQRLLEFQDKKWTGTVHTDPKGCAYVVEQGPGETLLALPPLSGAAKPAGTLKNGVFIKERGGYTFQGAALTMDSLKDQPDVGLVIPAQCSMYRRVLLVDSGVQNPTPPTP